MTHEERLQDIESTLKYVDNWLKKLRELAGNSIKNIQSQEKRISNTEDHLMKLTESIRLLGESQNHVINWMTETDKLIKDLYNILKDIKI